MWDYREVRELAFNREGGDGWLRQISLRAVQVLLNDDEIVDQKLKFEKKETFW